MPEETKAGGSAMSCPFAHHVRASEPDAAINESASAREQELQGLGDVETACHNLSISHNSREDTSNSNDMPSAVEPLKSMPSPVTNEEPADITTTGEPPIEASPAAGEVQEEASAATSGSPVDRFYIPYEPYEPCNSKYLSELLDIMAFGHRLQHEGLPRFQVHSNRPYARVYLGPVLHKLKKTPISRERSALSATRIEMRGIAAQNI